MRTLLFVGLGGCVGAIARYSIGEFVKQRVPAYAHSGTFVVNVIGCLLIGLVMNVLPEGEGSAQTWRLMIVTGCLGALTTFSTFGYETVSLVQDGRGFDAMVNVLANVAVGLPAVWLGMQAGTWLRAL